MPDSLGIERIIRGVRTRTSPKLRGAVRDLVARADNTEVRQARQLVARLRSSPPDVIFFAESAGKFVGPDDHDKRGLAHMVQDELPGVDVHLVMGPGHNPRLQDAYLRLVGGSTARPLVLHPLWLRGWFRAWYEHPKWGHREAAQAIRRFDVSAPLWRMRASLPQPGAKEFDRYHSLRYKTIVADLTVGEYVRLLKSGSPDSQERLRMLYAYHFGAEPTPDISDIGAVTQLGRRLCEIGCRTVAYHTPLPIQAGAEFLGPSFSELVDNNFQLSEAAYLEGLGREATILQTGALFEPDEFIDRTEGLEHLNERGRLRLAQMIAKAVADELERD